MEHLQPLNFAAAVLFWTVLYIGWIWFARWFYRDRS